MKSIPELKSIYGEVRINSLSFWQVKQLRMKGSKMRICSKCGTIIVMGNRAKFFSRCPQCGETFRIYRYGRGDEYNRELIKHKKKQD